MVFIVATAWSFAALFLAAAWAAPAVLAAVAFLASWFLYPGSRAGSLACVAGLRPACSFFTCASTPLAAATLPAFPRMPAPACTLAANCRALAARESNWAAGILGFFRPASRVCMALTSASTRRASAVGLGPVAAPARGFRRELLRAACRALRSWVRAASFLAPWTICWYLRCTSVMFRFRMPPGARVLRCLVPTCRPNTRSHGTVTPTPPAPVCRPAPRLPMAVLSSAYARFSAAAQFFLPLAAARFLRPSYDFCNCGIVATEGSTPSNCAAVILAKLTACAAACAGVAAACPAAMGFLALRCWICNFS